MKTVLIENSENGQKVYDSLMVDPKHLSIFSSVLAVKIINELAKQPMCAMDMGKKLKEHEQKIYYHLRKMRDAGIVRLSGTEPRYGMTAKMFELVSPVLATKLNNDGYESNTGKFAADPDIEQFLKPFISNGKLNATIIVGAPSMHGKYSATARDGVHLTDFALFLGRFVDTFNGHNYKLDVEIKDNEDLKDNIIVIGGPKINTVAEKINGLLPIFFDVNKQWTIVSKLTKNNYNYDDDALIVRDKNPFNKKKELLWIAGRRSQGLRSAMLAFTRHTHEVIKGNIENEKIMAKIVRGVDKDADGIVDSVMFME